MSTLDILNYQWTNKFVRDIESSTYRVVILCKLIDGTDCFVRDIESSTYRVIPLHLQTNPNFFILIPFPSVYLWTFLVSYSTVLYLFYFFTTLEALRELRQLYFTGNSMEPIRSLHAVADGTVKAIGHLFAASICNYGPAPNFVSSWVFNYIVGGVDKILEDLPVHLDFDNNDDDKNLCEVYNQVYIYN